MLNRRTIIAALAVCLAPLLFAQERTGFEERNDFAMGTKMRILLVGDVYSEPVNRTVAEAHRLEEMLTTFRPDSLVSRLNRRDPALPTVQVSEETWYKIPHELYGILRECQRMHDYTEGCFDPTVHSLIEAWGFGTDKPREPSKRRLRAALAGVGMKNVLVEDNPSRVRFLHPATKLNFGGIGKGYAMDRAAAMLKDGGFTSGVIEFGRSFLVWGLTRSNPYFITAPWPDNPQSTVTIATPGAAFSTSSQSEQYFKSGGKKHGHILDPKTGLPVENEVLSATVIATDAASADALSTGLFVMGFERARALLIQLEGVDAVLFHRDGDSGDVNMFVTPALKNNLLHLEKAPLHAARTP